MTSSERSELLSLMNERQIRMAHDLEAILTQTKLTNGRVSNLENWRSRMGGIWFAFAVITPIVGAAIGFVVTYFWH